ncbi:MAG: dTDP-4-amino-4,6-dideoxygalactose transaminase [Omnitrophica bacterium]|nr:dTDP-4-amino-4,6-dideoxygalactose transaminase [Candidatus Omnitrophota bacterium]
MIPYFVPTIGRSEKKAVSRALSKKGIKGNGELCREAEEKLKGMLGASSVFLTTSGTHALELALMALRIKKGDEVICPSFTFVSTANAIIRQGARPVFAEIEKSTLNMDLDSLMGRITKRTRAIIPVHYGGFSCDIERLVAVSSKRGIHVVEDAAQAIGARFNERHLGTFGDLGCISFHSTKNITCGEGGAIVVNRKNLQNTIKIMREKGTNRFLYLQGKIKKYTWIDIGSSFVVPDMLAALLSAQLDRLHAINKKRRAIFELYEKGLRALEKKGLIALPHPNKNSYGNGHIFWILLRKGLSRDNVIKKLRKRGIECTHHYVPLHSSPFGSKYLGYRPGDFPITEEVAKGLIRLPLHTYLSYSDIRHIIANVAELLEGRG